jgi:diguanylate cyclase (GGDEF)-like protein/PAS domain S-box-containing protein
MKRVEERRHRIVHKRDERYRVLVQTAPDGMLLASLDGTILLANEAAARFCGRQHAEDLCGRPMVDLVHPDDQTRLRNTIDNALQTGRFATVECRLRGAPHPVAEFAVSVSMDERGEPAGLVSVVRDVSRYKQREAELEVQTLHDPLTGLPNRVLFHDRLAQAIESARRSAAPVGVLYIDLDHFKAVNDRCGHDFGDVLLRQTAHRMQRTMRASDTLGRLGGDEFAVVLPQTDVTGTAIMAAKLKDELGRTVQLGGNAIAVGASIGIAVYPVHGDDAPSVLRQADSAMYADKRSRRGHGARHSGLEDLLEASPLSLSTASTADVIAVQVDHRVLSAAERRRERFG